MNEGPDPPEEEPSEPPEEEPSEPPEDTAAEESSSDDEEAPQYREVSPDELKEILAEHAKWVESALLHNPPLGAALSP